MTTVAVILTRPELLPLLRRAAQDPEVFRHRWRGITPEQVAAVALEHGYFDQEVVRLAAEMVQAAAQLTKEELAAMLEEVGGDGQKEAHQG